MNTFEYEPGPTLTLSPISTESIRAVVPSCSSTVAAAGKQDLDDDETEFGLAVGMTLPFSRTEVGAVVELLDGKFIPSSTVTFVVIPAVEVPVPLIGALASVVIADVVVLVVEAVAVTPNIFGLTSLTNMSEVGLLFGLETVDDKPAAVDGMSTNNFVVILVAVEFVVGMNVNEETGFPVDVVKEPTEVDASWLPVPMEFVVSNEVAWVVISDVGIGSVALKSVSVAMLEEFVCSDPSAVDVAGSVVTGVPSAVPAVCRPGAGEVTCADSDVGGACVLP
jgi:hypothetical protein